MKQATKTPIGKVEDIERAAWFARLAFGIFVDDQVPLPNGKHPTSGYCVMP